MKRTELFVVRVPRDSHSKKKYNVYKIVNLYLAKVHYYNSTLSQTRMEFFESVDVSANLLYLQTKDTLSSLTKKSHIAVLLVRRFHENVQHQGRVFTEGVIRSHGFWIIGAKRIITSVIHKCVICRKLRKPSAQQIMADLTADRVVPSPQLQSQEQMSLALGMQWHAEQGEDQMGRIIKLSHIKGSSYRDHRGYE